MKKVLTINAKEAMPNNYRERYEVEKTWYKLFNLDNYKIVIKGYEVGSFYEFPFIGSERVNDTYFPYIDCEFKDVSGNYHNYKSLYDGGKIDIFERVEETKEAELTLAQGITFKTFRKPAADLEDLESVYYDAEDAEETKAYYTYDYKPLKKRYTAEAVKAAEAVLKEWNVPVKYTGRGNYRKIENICDAAAAAQNCFVSFPLVCGIENICTRHENRTLEF